MTTFQVTRACDLLSETSMFTIRQAINTRRQDLLHSWQRAFVAGEMSEEYGCGFWADKIRRLNDAAIEFGMSYQLD